MIPETAGRLASIRDYALEGARAGARHKHWCLRQIALMAGAKPADLPGDDGDVILGAPDEREPFPGAFEPESDWCDAASVIP